MTFSHPLLFWPAAALALLALALGLRASLRPGLGVRVVGQRPLLQGLGLALLLGGAGLGLAEPRWGTVEVPRLTVHVVLDASRSMLVPDGPGGSRWQAATAALDRLWSRPNPGVRFSLQLLTGDAVPVLPPGEDQPLLRDALRAPQAGDLGSPGTSFGLGLAQAVTLASPGEPAVMLLLSDGEETVQNPADALGRAGAALKAARLPLFAIGFGQPQAQPVPGAALSSTARPDFLGQLAAASGGRLLRPGEDPAALFQALAQGREPLPAVRSLLPAHPEWGAWAALAGLTLWLLGAGKPLRAWRPILGLALGLGLAHPARALPVPRAIQAWAAQAALERGDLAAAQRWKPTDGTPGHRLLAAQIDLRAGAFQQALDTLAPMTGQGAPRPLPPWRAPALLMAARALVQLHRPGEARTLLERLLLEQPGRPEAGHDLQALLQDPPPPSPPKPTPPRPSNGAREDELEGLRQRLPSKPHAAGGVKDI
ncbi:MAG: VWA domain-containing protein [Holophaga sp.]|nr:VWA domain-containing protein [Holophaga sp.]